MAAELIERITDDGVLGWVASGNDLLMDESL
jgi:hypothetical protein